MWVLGRGQSRFSTGGGPLPQPPQHQFQVAQVLGPPAGLPSKGTETAATIQARSLTSGVRTRPLSEENLLSPLQAE